MNNLVIISGDEIAYTWRIRRPNGTYIQVGPEQMLCSKGIIFPVTTSAYEIPLWLDDPESYYTHPSCSRVAGLLVTRKYIHEMSIINGQFHRVVVPWGDDVVYAKSDDVQMEMAALAAVELTSNLHDALDLIHKTLPFDRKHYSVGNIEHLLKVTDPSRKRKPK